MTDQLHLFQRHGSPRWYVLTPDGKRLSTGETDRERALAKAHEMVAAQATPLFSTAFSEYVTTATLRPNTRASYKAIASLVLRELGDFRLAELNPTSIRDYVRQLRARGLSDSTIRGRLILISRTYDIAEIASPVTATERRKLKAAPLIDRHLKPQEFETILASIKNAEHRRMLIVLVGTGLRSSEFLSLKWTDIDWSGPSLEIGTLSGTRTKSGRSRRVAIMPEVEEALKTQLTTQFGGSFSPETAGRAAGFVFPQADGVTRRQGLHYLKRCIQKIPGMQHVRIHDLRHTFASWFLQRGVDPLAVQAALGHSTLAMTSRYARHSTDTQQALFRRAGLPVQTQSGIKPIQKLEKEEEK